jgi:hypothetical protein
MQYCYHYGYIIIFSTALQSDTIGIHISLHDGTSRSISAITVRLLSSQYTTIVLMRVALCRAYIHTES